MVAASRRNERNRIRGFHPFCRRKIIWTSASRLPNCKRVEIRYIHSTSWYSVRSKSESNSAAAAS